MNTIPLERPAVLAQLNRILDSQAFQGVKRTAQLLEYLVRKTVDGEAETLKEYAIAVDLLGRGSKFDSRTDPIVRAEASRLRQKLDLYYATEGFADAVEISLPKGTYVPVFLPSRKPEQAPAATAVPNLWLWRIATFALSIAVIALAWRMWIARPAAQRQPMRFDVDLGAGRPVASEVGTDFALSPDGRAIVFVALNPDGQSRLYKRDFSEGAGAELAGTEGVRNPFFSPDGRWIGFWAQGKLKKVLLEGGSPVTLCEATDLLGASWGEDDTIVAALDSTSRLWRIPSNGGPPKAFVDLSRVGLNPKWPQIVSNGRGILFTSLDRTADNSAIAVLDGSNQRPKILIRGGTYARYLPSGYLLYLNRGALFATRFDGKRLKIVSPPVRVLDDVSYSPLFGYAQFTFSSSGTFMYRKAEGKGLSTLDWLEASSGIKPLLAKPGLYQYVRLSPAGQRVAFSLVEGERQDIWTYDWAHDKLSRITQGERQYAIPAWTPDGRFLVMAGAPGMFWQKADGTGTAQRLLARAGIQVPWSFSPDGRRLAYYEMDSATGFDLWTVPIENRGDLLIAGTPEPYLRSRDYEVYPSFSPDGRWIAYGSNASGSWEVYVRAFPDNGTVVQVSRNGGRIPVWLSNRRELVYRTDLQQLMSVGYRVKGADFQVGPPRPWTETKLADTGVVANFDFAAGGKEAVGILPVESPADQAGRSQVSVIVNFFDLLRSLVDSK
jgi:serine/threonine-protein kinase